MSKRKKTKASNLHALACELAKMDAPDGFNASVIEAETTLCALGNKLRALSSEDAIALISKIITHGTA